MTAHIVVFILQNLYGSSRSVIMISYIRTPSPKRDENRDEIPVLEAPFRSLCKGYIKIIRGSTGTFGSKLKVLAATKVIIDQNINHDMVSASLVVRLINQIS